MLPTILLYIVISLYGIVISLHELRLSAAVVRPRTAVQLPGAGRQMSEMQGTYLRSVPRHRGTERSAVPDRILEIWDERGFPSLLLVV